MMLFDCNCSFGQNARPAFRYARDAAGLVDEIDFCGIDQALVYHTGMRFGSPVVYNEQLQQEIRDVPRLFPTWTILPTQTGEGLDPDELLAVMRKHNIRALRAFPQEHHYRLDKRTLGELMAVLTERRIPIFLKDSLITIGDLLSEFPNLTAVAVNQGPHSLERYLRPLFDTFPNFHLETSYYIIEGAVEEFCERYGPERLLFGSGFPDNCSGGAVLQLLHADIGEPAREAIAGGNLKRLLDEAQI